MPDAFASATKRMLDKLPYWWKIKKNPGATTGAPFLNVIGMELDEARHILDYALQQIRLYSADIRQADICYQAELPRTISEGMNIQLVTEEGIHLLPARTLVQFFAGFSVTLVENPELLLQHPYYIDYELKTLYVRYPYNAGSDYPEGKISLIIHDNQGSVLVNEPLRLYLHHVWNFFDEFGLILDCPRIYGEVNVSYKDRLLDVMRFPGGAHPEGMINNIARGLMLKFKQTWYDAGEDLVIARPHVAIHSLRVDDKPVTGTRDEHGRVIIKGSLEDKGARRVVTFAAAVEPKLLWDRSDSEFMKSLFVPDGDATARLKHYVKYIKDRVPIEWGQFKWNQGVWDPHSPATSGVACIPSFCDASVRGWASYGGAK